MLYDGVCLRWVGVRVVVVEAILDFVWMRRGRFGCRDGREELRRFTDGRRKVAR